MTPGVASGQNTLLLHRVLLHYRYFKKITSELANSRILGNHVEENLEKTELAFFYNV